MKSGYKIQWTEFALDELDKTIEYLQENFTDKEIKKLAAKIESVLELISINPFLFQKAEGKEVYRADILQYALL